MQIFVLANAEVVESGGEAEEIERKDVEVRKSLRIL